MQSNNEIEMNITK